MKPIEILQGKWLHHPVHAAIVHVPLALWIGAAVIDVASVFYPVPISLVHLALCCVVVGLAGALVAVPTGIADWLPIKPDRPAKRLGWYHMAFNAVAVAIWTANLVLRLGSRDQSDPIPTPVVILSVIGALILLVSGYLGSLLAFEYGVGVARFSKKKWRKMAEQAGGNLPPES